MMYPLVRELAADGIPVTPTATTPGSATAISPTEPATPAKSRVSGR